MGFLSRLFAGDFSVRGDDHWLTRAVAPITFAGTAVSETTALTLSAVYSAVSLISDALAQLPIDVVKTERQRSVPIAHDVQRVFGTQPNEFMTSFTLRNTSQAHALLWGDSFSEIQRTEGGDPIALWPLLPDRTVVRRWNGGIWYETTINGRVHKILAENILHVPALSFDGIQGLAPIRLARQAVGLGLGLEEYGARFFGNDSKSGGFLKHPGKLSFEAQENIRKSIEQQAGLTRAHRLKVLEEGMEFQNMTVPPEDAQFIKTREFQVEEIARWYRVPLFMLASHAKDTSWGTGIAEQSLAFLRYTLAPWIIRWEQEVNRKMFTEAEQADGIGIKHNVTALLRPDSKGRSEFYTKALNPQTGWMTRDEVRDLENLAAATPGQFPVPIGPGIGGAVDNPGTDE